MIVFTETPYTNDIENKVFVTTNIFFTINIKWSLFFILFQELSKRTERVEYFNITLQES